MKRLKNSASVITVHDVMELIGVETNVDHKLDFDIIKKGLETEFATLKPAKGCAGIRITDWLVWLRSLGGRTMRKVLKAFNAKADILKEQKQREYRSPGHKGLSPLKWVQTHIDHDEWEGAKKSHLYY